MKRRNDVNMLSGSITGGLLRISIPVMIMNVLQSLFSVIDMAVLKTYDTGGNAIGAVGVCGSLLVLITGVVIGVATGVNVVIARNIGSRDQEGVDRAVGCAIAFSLAAGVVLAVIGVSCAELFLRWCNCPEGLLHQATVYFRMYFAGVPLLMLYNFCASILRASGNSMGPMIYLSLGGAVKVLCNFLLIPRFPLGVMGVAVSTIISWSLSAALCLWTLFRGDGVVRARLGNIRFYKGELMRILHIGVPAGLQQGLYSIANVIISATVNSFGEAATTGISIANNYDGILYQICVATSLGVMPYVSQNIGGGNVRRAMQAVWKGIGVTVFLGATLGALSALFSTQLASILSPDPEVIGYARQKMIIISSTYFICGINDIFGGALRGMGKPAAATVTTLVYMCLFRFVWVYLIFPLVPNLTFLYLVWPIGWVLSILTLLAVFFPTAKKLKAEHPSLA